MQNPVRDVPRVIHALTQSSPDHQQATIRRYFVPDAAFIHPFCRVDHSANSRWWIEKIYRWYKIMSPRIELQVNSVAFDEKKLLLYANIHQIFKIWAIPFHSAPVDLVTVLELVKYTPTEEETHSYAAMAATPADRPKPVYFIKSQTDLYQTNEMAKFLSIFRVVWAAVFLWQWLATLLCALGTYVLWPVTWVEQNAITARGSDATPKELVSGLADEAWATGHEAAQKLAKRAHELKNGTKKDQEHKS